MPDRSARRRRRSPEERSSAPRRAASGRETGAPRRRRRPSEATGTPRGGRAEAEGAAERRVVPARGDGGDRIPLPLGLKIAVFTACLLVVLTVTVGQAFSKVAIASIDERINSEGKQIVGTIARTIDRVFWERSRQNGEMSDEQWLAAKARAARFWNKSLEEVVMNSDDILQVIVVDDIEALEQQPIVSSGKEEIHLKREREILDKGGFRVREYEATSGGRTERIRRFDFPILDTGGPSTPGATVFLSARNIDEAKAVFVSRITGATVVAVLAGIILSFVAARVLTSPLRILMRDIRAVSGGDLDHRSERHSLDEIGSLAETFDTMTLNLKAARDQALEQRVLEHELDIATEIQTALLPGRIPQIQGYDMFAHYLSAREVGGDYYDFIQVDGDHLGMVVADVSGKGIPGSMVMTMARSLIRLASLRNPSPADTLRKVNRALSRDMRRGMFVTAVYMILDPKDKVLRVSSAGHNPLLHYRAGMGAVEQINPRGIALGFDKGPVFDSNLDEITVSLEPGDRILAYTDGVVEALSAEGEEFGEEKLEELVRSSGEEDSKSFVHRLVGALEEHQKGTEQSDDITITTFRLEKKA